jgi:hypothetical protein
VEQAFGEAALVKILLEAEHGLVRLPRNSSDVDPRFHGRILTGPFAAAMKKPGAEEHRASIDWSGTPGSNRRPSPWQFGGSTFTNLPGASLAAQALNFTRDGSTA